MNFHNAAAETVIPDTKPPDEAMRRVTHPGTGAYQDDQEFMAFHGILEWLPDSAKVLMDVSGKDNPAAVLNGLLDSRIAAGKRYDLATLGRRAANAAFSDSHSADASTQPVFGMDLTPLVADDPMDILEYVCGFIDHFQTDVCEELSQRPNQS